MIPEALIGSLGGFLVLESLESDSRGGEGLRDLSFFKGMLIVKRSFRTVPFLFVVGRGEDTIGVETVFSFASCFGVGGARDSLASLLKNRSGQLVRVSVRSSCSNAEAMSLRSEPTD